MADITPPQVDASMINVVIELQAKYQAAFGKPEDSDVSNYPSFQLASSSSHPSQTANLSRSTIQKYKNYAAAAWLCFNHNSNGEPTKIKDTVKRPAQKRKAAALKAASSSGAAATGGPDPSAGPSVDPVEARLWELLVMEAALGVAEAPARSGTGTRMDCSP